MSQQSRSPDQAPPRAAFRLLPQSWQKDDRVELATANRRIAELEQQLELYDAWCQAIDEHADFGMWVRDAQGRYAFVNRAYEGMSGQPRASLLDKSPEQLYPPELARRFEAIDRKVIEDGTLRRTIPCDATGVVRTFDEVRFPIRNRKGELLGMGCLLHELTEQGIADQALIAAQQVARIGSWRWSTHQRCLISCSDEYARLFGAEAAAISGQAGDIRLTDAMVEADIPAVLAAYDRAEALGVRYEIEYRIRRPDGTIMPVHEIGEPVCNADGELVEFTGTLQDISERKAVEEALREAGAQLEARVGERTAELKAEILARMRAEQAMRFAKQAAEAAAAVANGAAEVTRLASRAKSDFLATISHEIRTPIEALLGSAAQLCDAGLSGEALALAAGMRAPGEALRSLIDNVLDIARIEQGMLELVPAETEISAILDGIVDVLAPAARVKGLALAAFADPELPKSVRVDGGKLRQILLNLAGNAVRFTTAGSVVLGADMEWLGDNEVQVRFSVKDTGIGIAANALPRIFERFAQVDGSLRRQPGGSGLGLAVSQDLVGLMGSAIEVDSAAGQGSCFAFTLSLPILQRRPDDALHELRKALNGSKAVIAEDRTALAGILERTLRSLGMDVIRVATAAEAIEASRQRQPSIVVLGQAIAAGGGSALLAELRGVAKAGCPRLLLLAAETADQPATPDGIDGQIALPLRRASIERALVPLLPMLRPRPQAVAQPLQPVRAKDGLRILLVEDNPANQKVALVFLQRAGHRIEIASDGLTALAMFTNGNYDTLLMDIQLPHVDGLHATRKIRSGNHNQHVPIIAMTANAMKGDAEVCLAVGMDAYFPKPIDWDRLLALLASIACGEQRTQRSRGQRTGS